MNVREDQTFQKGNTGEEITYPVKDPSKLKGVISPREGNCHGVKPPVTPMDECFFKLVNEVTEVRKQVCSDNWPAEYLNKHFLWADELEVDFDGSEIPEPLADAGVFDAESAAHIVRMDKPHHLGEFIFDWLVERKVPFQEGDYDEFADNWAGFFAKLSTHVHYALNTGFEVKYEYGLVRYEECVDLPGAVVTSYEEGCPRHPGYIAGHSVVAGATITIILEHFDFTDNQYELEMVLKAAYHFAMYRTFAGVHLTQDNIEGLKLGRSLKVQ